MAGILHGRMHARAAQVPTLKSALLTAGAIILTIVTILFLFFGVLLVRVS
ncbi:MAG TPA: hypothetical protein VMH28_33350 [Candidatus Acidoferrales bacterium]|nr:hypothetical protein [Candidatus Acidoferrales bacterium]